VLWEQATTTHADDVERIMFGRHGHNLAASMIDAR